MQIRGKRLALSPKGLATIRQLLATLSAAWTCVSHGLLTGYTAQAIPSMMKEDSTIKMSEMDKKWITSIVPLVAMLSAPLSSPLCSTLGRRRTMMSMTIPMTAGWLIITFATDSSMILIGRALCSAVSSISVSAYSYVAEIANSSNRGFLGSLLSVGWTFGLVISYTLGSVLDWNFLALSACTVPIAQLIVLWTSEDSPRWLVSRAKLSEAKTALAFFRGCSDVTNMSKHVECELNDMEHQMNKAGQANLGERLKMMVASAGVRKAVMICLTCFVFTVATGFTVVNYHAKLLLVQARVTEAMDPNLGTILIGLCQMVGNLIGAALIDKVGRKTLLYVSSTFLALSQAGLGTYFYFELNSVEAAAILANYRWFPLVLLLIFVVFLPLGWGSVTYILVSEIVPTSVRTEVAVLCNSWEQLLQFGVLQLHSVVCGKYGPQYLHWGFALTSAMGAIFVWIFVPETSGKTLEEIETFFTHLRREAMDMIGDRAACREPTKQPFFIFESVNGSTTKITKAMEAGEKEHCKGCNRH